VFRKQIKEETGDEKLPASQTVDLVLALKNISKENVMIWPRGAITHPDLELDGPGIIGPENLKSFYGGGSGTSVQPTIAPGKTHRISIKSLNPGEGTPFTYWYKLGEYSIKASYVVYAGLPPFPFPRDKKPKGKPQRFVVTALAIKVQVVGRSGRQFQVAGDDPHARLPMTTHE
jgi:hypothetical protein